MANREINVLDLLCDILAHWRAMIVFMLVGAVLFGALGYRANYKAAYSAEEERRNEILSAEFGEDAVAAATAAQADEPLTESEIANVETIIFWEKQAETKEEQRENSFLGQLDYRQVYVSRMTFSVSSFEGSGYAHLGGLYIKDYGKYFMNWLSEKKPELLEEWNNDGFDASSDYINNSNNYSDREEYIPAVDFVYVAITAKSYEICKEVSDEFVLYMKDLNTKLTAAVGDNQVVLLNDGIICERREDVLNKQKNWENDRVNALSQASSKKASLSDKEKAFYDLRKSGLSTEEATLKFEEARLGEANEITNDYDFGPINVKGSINKKYILLGVLAFMVLFGGIRFLIYLLSGKIKECDDIKALYDIDRIGTIYSAAGKKKVFAFVDNWISKLRHCDTRMFTREKSIELAGSSIGLMANKLESNEIYAVGCDIKDDTLDIINALSEKLKKNDVKIVTLSDLIYDSAALEELKNAKNAFLVEKAGNTMYTEISKEKEILLRQGVNILGALIIE